VRHNAGFLIWGGQMELDLGLGSVMDYPIFAAFSLGLVSTLHCIGMCGGIMASLTYGGQGGVSSGPKVGYLLLAYNLGRISSYTFAGALVASLGDVIFQTLSPEYGHLGLQLIAALMMFLIGLYIAGWFPQFVQIERLGHQLWPKIEPLARRLLPVTSLPRAFVFGAIWGWLPCGLVYSMLITATSMGSAGLGGLYMLAFGLGTLPALLLTGVFAGRFFALAKHAGLRRWLGCSVMLVAVFFVYRLLFPEHHHHG